MGEVYDAVDLRLDRPVALKRLRADMAEDPSMRRRVQTEARLAARLTHPNVVTVFDSGLDGGHPFIVMERLEGRTLADEMASGPMPTDRACAMALQVLGALAAAHAIGLIHRDVKPGNILAAAGEGWKVADFGIATSTDSDHTITRTGELLGSPSYLAPERLEGHAATARSDLYSLGVVLYEAVSGSRPFGETNPWALGMRIRDGRYEPVRDVAPGIDPDLAATIERAMSRDPSHRFGSAEEMAQALAGPSASTQVIGAPPTAGGEPTVVLDRPVQEPTAVMEPADVAPSSRAAAPATRSAAPRHVLTFLLIAAVLVVAIATIVALAVSSRGPAAGPAPAPTTSRDPGVPVRLQDALDSLQETIVP